MGRSRNKYRNKNNSGNPSVPEASNVKLDENESKSLELKGLDDHNVLILSQKTKTKKSKPASMNEKPKRKLTKKQRRKLQQVLDRKEKKSKRGQLLEDLSKVQVKPSELAMMSSVAHLGTKNSTLVQKLSKRPLPNDLMTEIEKLNSIRSSKKKKKQKLSETEQEHEDQQSDEISDQEDEEMSEEECSANKNVKETESSSKYNESENEEINNNITTKNSNDPKHPKSDKTSGLNQENSNKNVIHTEYVPVIRDDAIQEVRLQLPIIRMEQEIIEAVHHNPTVVLCGETGSGKTTQVPQFLYEAGYARDGMIGVTEPRRVAAISMSHRVGKEMSLTSDIVSYQIRYEGNTTENTKIKFMTDGVLLREVQKDFMLTKYSVVIIDEAHERSVYTDVLIGLLSRIVPLRHKKGKPLKLIIMSATLRVQDFVENTKLFKVPPPLIKVEARQFPVTVHFNRTTPMTTKDGRPYIKEAYRKICKIHRTLPAGGILVFVTGQHEVHSLCRMLRTTFPFSSLKKTHDDNKKVVEDGKNPDKMEQQTKDKENSENAIPETSVLPDANKEKPSSLPTVNLDQYSITPGITVEGNEDRNAENEDAPAGLSDDEEMVSDSEIIDDEAFTPEIDQLNPLYVLPLYSLLAPFKQQKIFKSPPENTRLCIVSTNVAETSLTIPGVKYVVDTGKVKKRVYDKVTGVSSFQVSWISRASADQRAGRAGRTSPGHTYRLYSSAVFQDFPEYSVPEIASRPVADLVLQMKQLNIDRVVNFPFPTPPAKESLIAAEKLLITLGAVNKPLKDRYKTNTDIENSGKITDLGKAIASFPVHPRFGKMLASASAEEYKDLLPYVITIVAALTVREVFDGSFELPETDEQKKEQSQKAVRLNHLKSLWGGASNESMRAMGDIMVLLGAVGSADYSGLTPGFCTRNCLRYKAMMEIRRLRSQLINTINLLKGESNLFLDSKLEPPSNKQIGLLRQIILSAFGDHVARKIPDAEINKSGDAAKIKKLKGGYYSLLVEDPVFIHPTSVLSQGANLPEYVVFQEIIESTSGRAYMKDVVVVDQDWLHLVCPQHCIFSQPLAEPVPTFSNTLGVVKCHVTATFGNLSWVLGSVEVEYPPGLNRYRWFANFLLDGQVIPSLKKWSSVLLSRPETMVKSWAKLQPRTEVILQELVDKRVEDRTKLIQAWKTDKNYLLNSYKQWIPLSTHNELICNWPPPL